MVTKTNRMIGSSKERDDKLIQEYIKNKSKEHCEVIGPDCERCSVSSHCVHRK
ncbi:MAG TPA: hypothetical protein VJB13_05185 [Candidatus Nanoarchaeia archaeon]|nr:hypothetical protein [Candidatus Nanoarchaeia archaeon]